MVGELGTFLIAAAIVRRPRPDVAHLDHRLPTSAYPSGHTAAACCLYIAVAILVIGHARGWWRWLSLIPAIRRAPPHRRPRQPPVLRALADRDLSTDEAERTQPPARETTQPDAASWGTCTGPPARLTGRARAESEHGWRWCPTVTATTPASGVIMTAAARGWRCCTAPVRPRRNRDPDRRSAIRCSRSRF